MVTEGRPWKVILPPLILFALWWGDFIRVFSFEWWINEQYSYGYLVLPLTAYLIYLRWSSRPNLPDREISRKWWIFPIIASALFVILRIILVANPEWRAALWLHALVCYGASLSLVGALGGKQWVRHFAVPLGLVLFAVPWPTGLEQPIVQFLMRTVASVTVEAINLIGIYAEREGNLIRLSEGLIGVEEACSGVRSLQSTIMAAYFLGELFNWKCRYRIALIVTGSLVTLLFNLGRTFYLSKVTIERGAEAMEVVHDPVGHLVSLGSFAVLFLITWVLNLIYRRWAPPPIPKVSSKEIPLRPVGWKLPLFIASICLLQFPAGELWYRLRGDRIQSETSKRVSIDWDRFANSVKYQEISPAVRAMLRYSDGEQVRFNTSTGIWTGFFFRWDPGRISSHAGVHRPDICLPAAGFSEIGRGETLPFSIGEDLYLDFETFVFASRGQNYFVFYSVWDTAPANPIPISQSWKDRLESVWRGQKIGERQSLEIILVGPENAATARFHMQRFLKAAVTAHN